MSASTSTWEQTDHRIAVLELQRAVDARRRDPQSRDLLRAVRGARARVRAIERDAAAPSAGDRA